MKMQVNGVETVLSVDPQVQVSAHGDRLRVRVNGTSKSALAVRHGDKVLVSYAGRVYEIEPVKGGAKASGGSGEHRAPMPGQIVQVLVAEGDTVAHGQKLMVLEAMKMQQPIIAAIDGTVSKVGAAEGDQVNDGQLLVELKAHE